MASAQPDRVLSMKKALAAEVAKFFVNTDEGVNDPMCPGPDVEGATGTKTAELWLLYDGPQVRRSVWAVPGVGAMGGINTMDRS